MGGTTFEHYAPGSQVEQAFSDARSDAAYEHGHGGYTGTIAEKQDYVVITTDPLTMAEADALIGKLYDEDDDRIRDKWGPAGAIPVISSTRKVQVKGFEHTVATGYQNRDKNYEALRAVVTPLVKLKKGESIKDISVVSYDQPQRTGLGYGALTTPVNEVRKNCVATVTINKPPTSRTVTHTVTIPSDLAYEARQKEIQAQVDASLKVRAGEKVLSWREVKSTAGKAKVTVVAPKGATETRFICGVRNRVGQVTPVRRLGHGDWDTGFTSQAEARKWLTGVVNNEANWVDLGPLADLGDNVSLEIESITRRADGQPLVSVTRQVGSRTVELEVEIKLANAASADKPDGWLFFGWAST